MYVPGGRAAYPSSVLMTVVPARVAGVGEVIAVSPAGPGGHPPVILAACHVAGIDALYRIGGAPLWHSAVTPFHGSNTVSPFVALASASS